MRPSKNELMDMRKEEQMSKIRATHDKVKSDFETSAFYKKSKKLAKRKTLKFAVDCSQPVDDGIMDAASFVSRERGAPGLDGWV